jgi:hypothetical protein
MVEGRLRLNLKKEKKGQPTTEAQQGRHACDSVSGHMMMGGVWA